MCSRLEPRLKRRPLQKKLLYNIIVYSKDSVWQTNDNGSDIDMRTPTLMHEAWTGLSSGHETWLLTRHVTDTCICRRLCQHPARLSSLCLKLRVLLASSATFIQTFRWLTSFQVHNYEKSLSMYMRFCSYICRVTSA